MFDSFSFREGLVTTSPFSSSLFLLGLSNFLFTYPFLFSLSLSC